MNYAELNVREKEVYSAGYLAGKNDYLDVIDAVTRLVLDHPEIDFSTPEGNARMWDAAEHVLQARNPRVRLTRAAG